MAKDIALCRARGDVSENYKQGNGMKSKGFWDAVMKYFERETGSVRGYDSILSKWKNRVRPRIGQFCAIINKIEQNHKSGSNDLNVYQKAYVEYKLMYKHDFTLEACWNILKDSETTSGLASGGFNLNNKADEFEKETQEHRPMGRDHSKAKNKSSTSSREGSSSFVDLVDDKFLNIKSTKWEKMQEQQDSYIKVKNRELDMQEAARKEAVQLKRAKLEIQRRTLELTKESYKVSKYIHGSSDATSTCTPTPLTLKELKVDAIVLSLIFTTLADTLQARLVVEHPRSAKEAWDLITKLVKDNKWSRTIALKAELRSLTLGDMSIDTYFQKIKSIATILTSLRSPVTSEDVFTFALKGLPDKYDNSKLHSLPMYSSSSSPMVRMAESGTNRSPSNPQVKSWRPFYDSAKDSCHFGNDCKFVRDTNAKTGDTSGSQMLGPTVTSGQETSLPHDFTARMLHDPAIGAWNMDTEKPPVLCHACQLGKNVRLPFVSSDTVVTSCFDIIHSDVWTSPIPSLSGFKYYILFLDHYSQFV
ncbi:ribonuclease H-like domain-containing protein [Tanacetum coccineum]